MGAMLHPLESKLAVAWPPADWADVTVIAAVSGGCDSVALLRAMAALKTFGAGRLVAAHLNHQLRPEADEDQRFVVDLCRRLGISCETAQVDVARLAAESGNGLEAAARTARYRFLEQTAARFGARLVATAHTADDQAETILHRIVRGTGIRGLSGMARARPLGHATLIRPLLAMRRVELLAYLDAIRQPYRHDTSNADVRFTRNRIRQETMPHLQERYNASAIDALLRLGSLAGEAQTVVDELVEELSARCVSVDADGTVCIALAALVNHPRYLLREVLMTVWQRQGWPMQSMGRRKWDELAELAASAESEQRIFPGGVTASVADEKMRLRKI
jgi:tRNA(Ile)-lysidine synthase